jgi:Probable lipoprotein LpqN
MKYLTAASVAVALSVAVAGCGSEHKTSTSTSTSTSNSTAAPTATTATTATTPNAHAVKSIADYVTDNHITETPLHKGDPGTPVVNLPTPPGWQSVDTDTSYGAFVLGKPANPTDPPSIAVLYSKLTGDVDPAKIIQYAPGEVQNLPGYQGSGNGTASTLSGFQAWQLAGSYVKDGKKRTVAQKTVVIPSQGAVFVLQLNADALDSDQGPLQDATNIIDDQTTITP